jgi:hypothetical protein
MDKKTPRKMTRKNRTMKMYPEKQYYETSMHGIQHWHDGLFERLGWMILAIERGYEDKIVGYRLSIQRLKCAIEHKMKDTRGHDRKTDLQGLFNNLCVLEKHVAQDFH